MTNRSDGNLIVPRNFSAPPNQFYIAVDGDALSEGHFEYRSRDDWTVDTGPSKSGPELLEKGPSLQEVQTADQLETTTNSGTKAPGSQFIVLRPREYTESTLDFGVAGLALSANRRTFGPGRHVIQYRIQSWTVFDPQVKAEEYKQRWSQFGALIYGPLETEAIPFDIPADPKSLARGKC